MPWWLWALGIWLAFVGTLLTLWHLLTRGYRDHAEW